MSGRVRIGTCSNPTDGAFVRSMFAARGIHVVIGAEHHASLLGPIGSAFLSLDIWVAADQAEEAAALLRDLREGKVEDAPDPTAGIDPDDPDFDGDGEWLARAHAGLGDAPGGAANDDDDDADADADAVTRTARALAEHREHETMRARMYQRRRTIVALLSGVFLTFGTAHIFTGAWLRGLAIAALEVVGIMQLAAGNPLGAVAIFGAIGLDLVGTAWRMAVESRDRTQRDALGSPAGATALPEARVQPRPDAP